MIRVLLCVCVYLCFALISLKKKLVRERKLLYFALVQSLMMMWNGTLPFDAMMIVTIIISFLLYMDDH